MLWDGYMSDEENPLKRLASHGWARLQDVSHPYDALLARWDGVPAGFISMVERFDPHTVKLQCYISCLYVLPEYRGRGIATKLMEKIFKRLDAGYYAKVEWKTLRQNRMARRWYDSLATRTTWVLYERP